MKFESVLKKPSHVVTSHSSAINLERTVSQKLIDQPQENAVSEPQKSVVKIPSPIKSTPKTLGLPRKHAQSSRLDSKAGPVSSNKWISTQSRNIQNQKKLSGTGNKSRPIKIGLMPTSQSKRQSTLNCFAKKNSVPSDKDNTAGETKSKYFQMN